MLAATLEQVPIVVGEDRYVAGKLALAELAPPPDLFLLDDGFSHLRLDRDLDVLTFPASDPFGGGRLLPSGRLREPLASAAAASAVLLTGLVDADDEAGEALASALREYGFDGPGFSATTVASLEPQLPEATAVVLVTGVAGPARVAATARELGLEVREHLAFADHHPYTERSLGRIRAAAAAHPGTTVLTTAKDLTKLATRLDLPLAVLHIEARPEPTFWSWLDQSDSISNSGSPPSTD